MDAMSVDMDGWPTNKMLGIHPEKWTGFKRWLVVQKFTLARGYSWLNVMMIGFIAASQFKLLFPDFFSGIVRFGLLIFATTFILWFIGYLDKKMHLLHEENNYNISKSPLWMEMIDNSKKKNGQKM